VTAPAKAPTRRTLATYPTRVEAADAAIWWAGPPENAKGVQVEPNTGIDAGARPFAVTAAKTGGGS
jgi:hypothetical protein